MLTIALVELSVFERITPLVSGYLQAYALRDETLRAECAFRSYSTSVKTPLDTIIRDVSALDADVYGLSCYVWNMGLIREVVRALRASRPAAHIILGGPQVMHHAERYLDRADERTVICDGEGELTFAAYLRELTGGRPDLARVDGITFARDGEFVVNQRRVRITDLNEIPSPYLTGLFQPDYAIAMLETNRGCPYHCGFCYWGAATNDRVYRFDEERVRDEITWMARSDVFFVYLADANWGMLARDVEFSEHIAASAREYRMPRAVYFSSAKNKPQAVTRITEIFQGAGLVASQPVSMQTLEPRSLEIIARSNIKLDAYEVIQRDLREKQISSYIELIWPLPGETLTSFRQGIGTLCQRDAQTIITYSHLMLHNTPIYRDRDRLGLVTRPAGGGVADAEIVIQTSDVSVEEFADGMRYFYAVHALHNTLGLRAVIRYLTASGRVSHVDLFTRFVDFWRSRPPGDPIVEFVETSIADAGYYDLGNYGMLVHLLLHAHRAEFTAQLAEFLRAQPWWEDETVRALFEIDLINRPYVYSNTPFGEGDYPFETVRVRSRTGRRYTVDIDQRWYTLLRDAVRMDAPEAVRMDAPEAAGAPSRFTVDHKGMQYPFLSAQTLDHNAHYCHGMIEKVENIIPTWRPAAVALSAGRPR